MLGGKEINANDCSQLTVKEVKSNGTTIPAVGSQRKYEVRPRSGHCKDTIFTDCLHCQQKIARIVPGNII